MEQYLSSAGNISLGKMMEMKIYFNIQWKIHVDVVTCLKGSDDNDEHNHLVISDLVSILRFEKCG